MRDYAYFIRPMHVAPRMNQVESADKFGIVMTCPAGDGEGDAKRTTPSGRIASRSCAMSPFISATIPASAFYEASNSEVSVSHMKTW